jgi:hypothetical protein
VDRLTSTNRCGLDECGRPVRKCPRRLYLTIVRLEHRQEEEAEKGIHIYFKIRHALNGLHIARHTFLYCSQT